MEKKTRKRRCNNNSVENFKKTEQLNSDDTNSIEKSNSSDNNTIEPFTTPDPRK